MTKLRNGSSGPFGAEQPQSIHRGTIAAVILAASRIASALVVRSGLVAIATQVRDKQMNLPEQIHLTAGDTRVEFNNLDLHTRQTDSGLDATIKIDEPRLTRQAPTPRPAP